MIAEHARLLVAHAGPHGIREFRKHASWYATGYPLGGDMRRRLALVASLGELDDLLATIDPSLALPPGGQRIVAAIRTVRSRSACRTAISTGSTTSRSPTTPTSSPSPADDGLPDDGFR